MTATVVTLDPCLGAAAAAAMVELCHRAGPYRMYGDRERLDQYFTSVRDLEQSFDFMEAGWNGHATHQEGNYQRYEVGKGGSGTIVDFRHDPDLPAGSWTFGEGTVHHVAFAVERNEEHVRLSLTGRGANRLFAQFEQARKPSCGVKQK